MLIRRKLHLDSPVAKLRNIKENAVQNLHKCVANLPWILWTKAEEHQ